MPRLTCSGVTRAGLPSTSANELFISGWAASARTIAYPIEVGEADLAAPAPGEVVVDHDAVVRDAAWPVPPGRWSRSARSARRPCSARSGRRRPGSGWSWRRSGPARCALVGLRAGSAPSAVGRRRPERLAGAARSEPAGAAGGRAAGARAWWPRGGGAAVAAAAGRRSSVGAPAGSRRRIRARRGRRWPGRRGTAGTCPRRSTRSDRSPPVGCPGDCRLGRHGRYRLFHARASHAVGVGRIEATR